MWQVSSTVNVYKWIGGMWRSGEGEQLQKPESVNQFPSASARHEMQVINFDV